MIDFDIKDWKLVVSAEVLTISAFNDIWESDKSKGKSKASNMLVYVFHMCDIRDRNFLRDVPNSQRDGLAKRNTFGNQDYKFSAADEKLIERAMAWYEVLNKNSVLRLSMALDKKLDEVVDFYNTNVIKTIEGLDDQTNSMAKIERILKAKKMSEDFVRSQTEKRKIKGDATRSPLAEGLLDKK